MFLGIFLDLSKALDTVDHEKLERKLELYGFRGKSLQWLSTFLSDRSQFVELACKRSSLCKIPTGATQGSTLVPLLFLFYIHNFHNSLSDHDAIHFTDDTTLYIKIEPSFDTINLINEELTQVQP